MPYELSDTWPQDFEKLIWQVIRNNFQGYRDENDLLQEGFMVIIDAAAKYDPEKYAKEKPMKFSTYVYQLVYWKLLRYTKKNRLDFSELPAPNGEYRILTNPETLISFSRLTEQAQLAIMLKIEGKSFTKIGEVLGVNRETARNFHKKSVQQFHNELE